MTFKSIKRISSVLHLIEEIGQSPIRYRHCRRGADFKEPLDSFPGRQKKAMMRESGDLLEIIHHRASIRHEYEMNVFKTDHFLMIRFFVFVN